MAQKKLTILAYSDEECGSKVGELMVQINPETISRKHSLSFSTQSGDTSTSDPKGNTANPGIALSGTPTLNMQTVSFSLFLDGTGLIDGTTGVLPAIEKIKDVCYYYKGKTHGLNYLKLEWKGVFAEKIVKIKFRLSSLDIEYLLFEPDGEPIRAKLSFSFTQFMSTKDIAAVKNNSSPDLTHMKTANAGDTLPLMCEDVYGDPKYYLQVAKINGLTSIHQMNRGQRLIFPPFEQ